MSKKDSGDLRADLTTIGEVLRRLLLVTEDAIVAAANRQAVTGEKLGEALVALGLVSEADLAQALDLQVKLRSSASVEAMGDLVEQALSRLRTRRTAAMSYLLAR